MKEKMPKGFLCLVCLLAFLLVTACEKEKQENEYYVYFKDDSGYHLSSKKYEVQAAQPQEIAMELLEQMNRRQRSDDYQVIKPENVKINGCVVESNVAYVYFSGEYQRMSRVTEVLYRAAVVKTLTQVDGIQYVAFYLEEQPLCYDNGNVIGLMSASDFIDDTDSELNNLQWTELKLYFANTKGDRLVPENISVAYSKSVNLERLVVEQLINGPQTTATTRSVPADLKILGVSVKNGVCYVNFSSAFINSVVNASANVTIYSIVNSLCELNTVSSVQILVNGQSKVTFRETVSLEKPFTANMELVTKD